MPVTKTAIVILGASGDLAQRKLIPALAVLHKKGEIDDTICIIGSGRSEYSDDDFRDKFQADGAFRNLLCYHAGIQGLKSYIDSKGGFDSIIVFLALPPKVYAATAKELAEDGFGDNVTLIVEKPFGYDFLS